MWYPTDRLFSPTGVLVSGFGSEQEDLTGKPTEFGALPTIAEKINASRAAVEVLHPGRSNLLTKPIYVNWKRISFSLGGMRIIVSLRAPPRMSSFKRAAYILRETIFHILSAGRKAPCSLPIAQLDALQQESAPDEKLCA